MSYGPTVVFTTSMASSATFSDSIDLHHGWDHAHLCVPTMASGSLYIAASVDDVTYYRVTQEIATATILAADTFMIDSSTTQRFVLMPPPGARYMKVESTSGTAGDTAFKVICS